MTATLLERIHDEELLQPSASRPLKTIRVGLAGCGVVGGSLVRLLDDCAETIAARHGVRIELSRILVRDVKRDRGLTLPSTIFTNDWASFVAEDVDVVVEAIGGTDTAGEIARAALRGGRKFITANKELIASDGNELAALARDSEGSLDFGASVGGSAPVISLLRDLLGVAAPRSVRGILNGTSNYLLTQIERGLSYANALANAQQRGLAEADSSRDLDGRDAAAKLSIIAWISYGIAPSALRISRIGLTPGADVLAGHAAVLGGRVRFLAECITLPGREIITSVEPVIVPANSSFGRTELEDNRVEVDLGWAAPLTVSGPGAGGPPTATALLGDLLNSALPRNERGSAVAGFTQVDDPLPHHWVLATRSSAEELRFVLDGSGVLPEEVIEEPRGTRIVAVARRPEILETIRRLDVCGLDPAVARLELHLAGRYVQ
jgi:homoserine dehydrogenase